MLEYLATLDVVIELGEKAKKAAVDTGEIFRFEVDFRASEEIT
jgi:hypothetical protein